ncbi:transglutaminase family protein [Rhizobium sp. P40RR-XXII]|uniref:transglutaminase family protein n=1 Tax=unclassified Rhizobium TaxID=2613769 RepID=UPI001456BD75|nr:MULTISPECIES: transglutaminase family protein [unclassified Rhizobium]NLR83870.1 transglutaminase family protein [Rhizobium sp. P28RR-XV]NLS15484.1 transglutaminase family protein [Rhizobium sp. P40RR-XXII]
MRLTISHITEYRYDEPAQFSLQRLRLTPLTGIGQTVIDWKLTVEGAKPEVEYDDQFGNRITLVSLDGQQDATKIIALGEVETQDLNGVLGQHLGFAPLWLYLRESPRTKAGKLTKNLLRDVSGDDELARMHVLMKAIHETVEYKPGTSDTETTAEQALEAKSGVCQDHAHIFIAGARALNIPARYVSGYLMMEGKNEQAATHAWAEAHIPSLGWVGFDPANDVCPDARYVRVATGLCYRDAAPVSGMRVGTPGETLTVKVTVASQGQSQSQS